MKIVIALLYIFIPFLSISQTDQYQVKFGERLAIHSQVLDETRDIWIYLPPNYNDIYHQPNAYPVLYVMDGDIHFHSLSGMVQILGAGLNGTYVIPEMIIVAILNTDRTRDLAPTAPIKKGSTTTYTERSKAGNNFLKFIKDELIPKVNDSYRTTDYRILVGQSLGGVAVINALFKIPGSFNAYVAIDPSLWWDDKIILNQIRTYFNHSNLASKTFFLAQANTLNEKDTLNAHYESIKELVTILETRNQSKLKWKYKYYENDSHASVAFVAEYDALRFIFRNYHANFGKIFSSSMLEDHYARFSDELQVHTAPPERVVQQFGNLALYYQQTSLAQEYFEMNIKNYPKSASAYADMGNLLVTKGLEEKALKFYEQSLQHSANNEHLRTKIKSLQKKLQEKE